jgi:cell division topological specificity factor
MNILALFRRHGSAPMARERLQILLSHERAAARQPDLLAVLQQEILATIARQVTVARENVRVRIDRGANVSTLEIDVEIPHTSGTAAPALSGKSYGQSSGTAGGAAGMALASRALG